MNKEELIKAFTLRVEGATYTQIANELGYTSPDKIWKALKAAIRMRGGAVKGIYPGLLKWMHENECTKSKLAEMTGLSDSTIRSLLQGERYPHGYTVERVLEVTGLTYEQAFKGETD